jgi:hypothetical protein
MHILNCRHINCPDWTRINCYVYLAYLQNIHFQEALHFSEDAFSFVFLLQAFVSFCMACDFLVLRIMMMILILL